jgi:hypothetical protein
MTMMMTTIMIMTIIIGLECKKGIVWEGISRMGTGKRNDTEG